MGGHSRAGNNLERAISIVGVGLVLLAIAWGIDSLRPSNDVFAPLGPYAVQKVTVWRISGIETPIDSETGRNGETATWLTEPFVLKAG